jgi:large subunit ribosomal protein L4
MTSVQLKDLKGKALGEVTFDESIFNIEPNIHVLHQALHRQLTNARSGTASTKTRSEVRGGGRKPWRQKGTGRARAGSIRSPLWNGGGVTFGPKPRDYSQSMPKKARQLALRSALSARRDQFVVVQNFDGLFKKAPKSGDDQATIEQPKTKAFLAALKDLGVHEKKVLLLLDSGVPGALQIERAARNLCCIRVGNSANLNVKDLMEAEVVLTTERTVETLNNRFKPHAQTETGAKAAKAVKPPKKAEAKGEQPATAKKAAAKPAAAKKAADEGAAAEGKKADKAKSAPTKEAPAAEGKTTKAKKKTEE